MRKQRSGGRGGEGGCCIFVGFKVEGGEGKVEGGEGKGEKRGRKKDKKERKDKMVRCRKQVEMRKRRSGGRKEM